MLFKKMICISSVHYNLLINISIVGELEPSRGLRQGEPISLYFFIMCIKILTRLLETNYEMQCVKVGRKSPAINHLL